MNPNLITTFCEQNCIATPVEMAQYLNTTQILNSHNSTQHKYHNTTPHALYIKVKTRAGSLLALLSEVISFSQQYYLSSDGSSKIPNGVYKLLLYNASVIPHCPKNSLIIFGTV